LISSRIRICHTDTISEPVVVAAKDTRSNKKYEDMKTTIGKGSDFSQVTKVSKAEFT